MASIEFIISANYEQVNEAIKKVEELKKVISSTKDTDPGIGKLEQELQKAQGEISKYANEIAQLKAILKSIEKSDELISNTQNTTRSTNEATTTFVKYVGTLDELNKKIKDLNKEYSNLDKVQRTSSKGQGLIQQIVSLNAQRDIEQNQLRALRREYVNTQKVQDAQEGSITALRAQLSLLTGQYDNLAKSMRKGASGQELLKSIKAVSSELSEAEQASGRFQRNVGNYASGFNGLSNSVQQVARELPSLAISVNTFFLAISNNLPILADEITKARKQYSDYIQAIKSGVKDVQKVAPVWKQVASSIFSWQSALVVAVTLLSVYGKDVISFTAKLLNFSSSVDKGKIALDNFNSSMSVGRINAQGELLTLELLYKAATDNVKSLDERRRAVKQLKSEYPGHFKNMADEQILAGKASKAYEDLTKSILKTAQARAAYDKIVENNKRILEINEELKDSVDPTKGFWGWADKNVPYLSKNFTVLALRMKYTANNVKNLAEERDALQDSNSKLAEGLNINDLFPANSDDNKVEETLKKLNNSILTNQMQLNAERLALMEEGRKKRLALSEQEWKERKAQLDKEYQDTVEQYKKIGQEVPKEVQTTYQARVEINDQSRDKRDKEINKEADREFADRQKALTNVLLSEEAKRTQAIKERYDKEREWAEKQLKSGDMDQEQYNKYIATVNVAEEKENLSSLLKDYATFQQNREKITAEYNEKIRKMNEANAKAAEKGEEQVFSVGNFEEAERQLQEAYDNLDSVLAQRDEDFKALAATISSKTTTELSKLINDADQQLKLLSPTNDKDAESMAVLRARIKVLQEQLNTARAKEKADDENKLLKWKKQVKALEDVKSATDDIIDSFDGLDESTKNILSAVSTVAGATISAIGTMTTLVDNAGNSMSLTAYMASKSISTVEKASVILTIISAALQVAMAIANLFNKDNKRQEEIERLQDQIDALQKAYDKLDKAIEKAYSNDASKLIDQQNKLLEQQKVLIRQQIREEEDKKKTDKDKLKDYQDQLDEIDEKIADNKVKAQDAIFGDDVQGAIDDFADAYLEAWEAGEDKAKSMKDVVKKMIKGVVTEMIKADLAPTIQGLRDKIQYMLTDGIIDDFEQAELDKIIEEESKKAENKYGWADKYIKEQEDAKRSAQAKGMAAMSQDTGDKLDGKFTAGLIYLDKMTTSSYDIAGSMKELTRQSYDGWKNVEAIRDISRNIEVLNIRIADNTEDIGTILKSINKNTNSSNENLEYMRTNGLYVKR